MGRSELHITLLAVVVVGVFVASPAAGSIQVLQPGATVGKDAYIRQDQATTNFGTSADLVAGGSSSVERRLLIEFTEVLTAIPSGSTINSAVLDIFFYATSQSGNLQLAVRPITSAWSESTVTWNTTPTFGSVIAGTQQTFNQTNLNSWLSFSITGLVQDWVDLATTNNGVMIFDGGANRIFSFRSSDFGTDGTTNAEFRPRLTIDYTTSDVGTVPEPMAAIVWLSLFALAVLPRGVRT